MLKGVRRGKGNKDGPFTTYFFSPTDILTYPPPHTHTHTHRYLIIPYTSEEAYHVRVKTA